MKLTAEDIAVHHIHIWKAYNKNIEYNRQKEKISNCMKRFVKTFGTNEEQKKFMGKNYE